MNSIVYIVDDDAAVTSALTNLLIADDYTVISFSSADDFLSHALTPLPCCLILDINLPGADGFDVAQSLIDRGYTIPTIFLTGFGTIPVTVRAMKTGAYEFLTKPVEPERILQAVAEALEIAEQNLASSQERREIVQRHQTLTPREAEVMLLAISGLLNKQIAAEMGVSEITAKVHKRRVMEKMNARSLTDLVRAAERLNIDHSRRR
ncbi:MULTISPECIES: response regulator [unclassified Pantoea]|uniref:response regulator transcription factor n=1 Tax=unclassified Pantoea TaxID=2630326 RepID=UPI0023DCA6C1|nr:MULTISPECIES: response regulator [unclassified Pantoea]MDF2041286.1 response regulator [Pantoea sp. Cr_R14]MDF2069973.1 response regulator [Pantoea sp. Cr_R13]MDF2078603.1 response regulator [Pantoea sp. Cr_R21]